MAHWVKPHSKKRREGSLPLYLSLPLQLLSVLSVEIKRREKEKVTRSGGFVVLTLKSL